MYVAKLAVAEIIEDCFTNKGFAAKCNQVDNCLTEDGSVFITFIETNRAAFSYAALFLSVLYFGLVDVQ